jgi:hypothetical protein
VQLASSRTRGLDLLVTGLLSPRFASGCATALSHRSDRFLLRDVKLGLYDLGRDVRFG